MRVPTVAEGAVAVVVLLALVGLVVFVSAHPGMRSRRRYRTALRRWRADYPLAVQWHRLLNAKQGSAGWDIAHITRIYGYYPRKGVKAVITWQATGYRQDTWFHRLWPAVGSWIVVRHGSAWGPHNRNPHVLYVNELGAVAAPAAPQAWQRCVMRSWQPPQLAEFEPAR